MLGTSPIFWKTKKQDTVSRSSVEAEYRAMVNATSETARLCNLLKSLEFIIPLAILHCNEAADFQEHMKHIEVDCHFV